ncbi:MAG: hypothetical protein OJF55_002405 [Rhodanobacteraceae bacterium]|jgi:hypothetical protein|nr:MAG: hypothetical protein OJF55_002405 [Rhodanobacteraceae bacterium]
MRKTLFAMSIATAYALAVPAFAQVHLGGVGQVTSNLGVGAHQMLPNPVPQTLQTTRQMEQQGDLFTHRTTHKLRKTADRSTHARAGVNATQQAGVSATTSAGDAQASGSAHADAGLNTAAAAGEAGEVGRGVGGTVRNTANTAIQSTNRTAGSVGSAVNGINASGNANASMSGHAAAQTHAASDRGHRRSHTPPSSGNEQP